MWKAVWLYKGLQVYANISGKVISGCAKLQCAVLQGMAMSFAQSGENLSTPRTPSLEFLQHYLQQLNMVSYIHLNGSLTNWSDFSQHFV